jgi:hypothetical protein
MSIKKTPGGQPGERKIWMKIEKRRMGSNRIPH